MPEEQGNECRAVHSSDTGSELILRLALHRAGYVLRFLGVVRRREDKFASEINTRDRVRQIYAMPGGEVQDAS